VEVLVVNPQVGTDLKVPDGVEPFAVRLGNLMAAGDGEELEVIVVVVRGDSSSRT
jgi:hypothetical protein